MTVPFHFRPKLIIGDFYPSCKRQHHSDIVFFRKIRYTEYSYNLRKKENSRLKITILCVGKIKEKFYRDAIAEYQKRLSRYCNLEIIEVADEKTPEHASETMADQIKAKEAERMEKYLKEGAHICALAIEGTQLDSVELSEKIDRLGTSGTSHIIFIIGGSLGLSEQILKRAHWKLSFSRMTFPHQLMRVILLEQIYRSYRIRNGEPYHK
jgi:23S rRNA (pseudouridine1915-N3)-methyltransferase